MTRENIQDRESEVIDLRMIARRLRQEKMVFVKVLPVVLVLSCLYIICIPRTFSTDTKLAPEIDNPMSGGTLGDLASSLGFNLGDMQSTDAITPLLYPDLMEDNRFVTHLFGIQVETADGQVRTTYGDYLRNHQEKPWWTRAAGAVAGLLASDDGDGTGKKGGFDPYRLSKDDEGLANAIRDNVKLGVDKKTGVVTISTEAQDPLICKTLADSVRAELQDFITDYRTNKARNDLEYYKGLMDEAKAAYEKARRLYGTYADSNSDVVLESYKAKQNDLENEMQLRYNNYTAMVAQYQAAKAKVQENTPAFTTLKGAAVPIKPTGPKRMLFVIGMMILATFGVVIYILKDELTGTITSEKQ